MKKRNLDIHAMFRRIDQRDMSHYDSLPDDAKKEFSGRVVQRWVSCARINPVRQLRMTNALVNRNLDKLADHPGLQYRLMCLTGNGNNSHDWIPSPKLGRRNDPVVELIWEIYPDHHYDEVERIVESMSDAAFHETIDYIGIGDEERKNINAAWKKRGKA